MQSRLGTGSRLWYNKPAKKKMYYMWGTSK